MEVFSISFNQILQGYLNTAKNSHVIGLKNDAMETYLKEKKMLCEDTKETMGYNAIKTITELYLENMSTKGIISNVFNELYTPNEEYYEYLEHASLGLWD